MEPVLTGISTVVSLFGLWKSQADRRKEQTINDFKEWLRRHDHQEALAQIENNAELVQALDSLVQRNHDEVMDGIANIEKVASTVAQHIDALRPLATAMPIKEQLSDQAVSILQQMNAAEASKFGEVKWLGGSDYRMWDGERGSLTIEEPRFLEDDLRSLCELGLLRPDVGSKGTRFFYITRIGAAIGSRINS